jgi:hypothetical protein
MFFGREFQLLVKVIYWARISTLSSRRRKFRRKIQSLAFRDVNTARRFFATATAVVAAKVIFSDNLHGRPIKWRMKLRRANQSSPRSTAKKAAADTRLESHFISRDGFDVP